MHGARAAKRTNQTFRIQLIFSSETPDRQNPGTAAAGHAFMLCRRRLEFEGISVDDQRNCFDFEKPHWRMIFPAKRKSSWWWYA